MRPRAFCYFAVTFDVHQFFYINKRCFVAERKTGSALSVEKGQSFFHKNKGAVTVPRLKYTF